MKIIVSPLSCVQALVKTRRPSHVLTLLSPDDVPPAFTAIVGDRHLKLGFNDIAEAMNGYIPPDRGTIQSVLDFGRQWNRASPLLVHCWAGISRSPAAAFILACQDAPGQEQDIALRLRRASPWATPNRLMIALADGLLDRGGAMIKAVENIGRGEEAGEGHPFDL